jgi:hypothetical protein
VNLLHISHIRAFEYNITPFSQTQTQNLLTSDDDGGSLTVDEFWSDGGLGLGTRERTLATPLTTALHLLLLLIVFFVAIAIVVVFMLMGNNWLYD